VNKRELLTHIQQGFGEGGLALAQGLVTSFSQGIPLDKKMGRVRTIEDTTVERDSRFRVSRALKTILQENNLLDYSSAAYVIKYQRQLGNFENFIVRDLDPNSLATSIYELMEAYHHESFDETREIYVPRHTYDNSLEAAIRGVAFV
jgi:hypothetical protein